MVDLVLRSRRAVVADGERPAAVSVAGGRIARIVVVESQGVVLPEINAEAVRDHLVQIDQPGTEGYHQPTSLDEETTIIAKALANG